jgi:hypothetical protein
MEDSDEKIRLIEELIKLKWDYPSGYGMHIILDDIKTIIKDPKKYIKNKMLRKLQEEDNQY